MDDNAKHSAKNHEQNSRIIPQVIEDEMKKAYLDYAMSVIVGRALPDVRDGLKPVHRRILYGMSDLGLQSSKTFKKCARIVGEILGKYHPHGDVAVYDSLVRMAQDFSLRYPLVHGQGNFGSIDGDPPAAMRYTEAKLTKLSEEILEDLEKETVDFVPNFDDSLKEPTVLPSKIPNLLINGSSGIAVGMATNIPPHNMTEVCSAVIALIRNPDMSLSELLTYVKGPDFPTGAEIAGRSGIIKAYGTGHGIITVKAKMHVEDKKGRKVIIVTEIPYQLNKSLLIEQIAELVKDKKIPDISDLRDESAKKGVRIVIELKKDANAEVVQNLLYTHSKLQSNFSIIFLALVNNEPKVLPLKDCLVHFLHHRQSVVRKRTEYDLKKAKERAHLLEGLLIALHHIDPVIALIKKSANADEAKTGLIKVYALTEIQSQAILDMRLQRLAVLEQEKIKTEHTDLLVQIKSYQEILADEQKILGIIKSELEEIRQKYGDNRLTSISDSEELLDMEDLIADEPVVVTVTRSGYIKRMLLETYKVQKRGGKGVTGAETKEEDQVEQLFVSNNHAYLLVFTNTGQMHWLKVYQIPEAGRYAMGKAIVNLLALKDEKIKTIIPVKEFDDKHFLVLVTKKGLIKKTNLSSYARPRKGGIIGIDIQENDALVNALLTDGTKQILIATKNGLAVKFEESDVRAVGRNAKGVTGVRLKDHDEVMGMVIADDQKKLLTITENGYGKRTMISEYRLINRGGTGVINIQCTERNGKVAAIKEVNDVDELMFISKKGIIIRTLASHISVIGRNTQGVRLMKLQADDKVVAAAKIVN
ncbi:DNA gyrase subunit A [Candidatus Woesearchaeota archaeon]|nr:MAG: DNA gyrase subunit A [Candidatus Woesearchaeota archaeon]